MLEWIFGMISIAILDWWVKESFIENLSDIKKTITIYIFLIPKDKIFYPIFINDLNFKLLKSIQTFLVQSSKSRSNHDLMLHIYDDNSPILIWFLVIISILKSPFLYSALGEEECLNLETRMRALGYTPW